MPPLTLILINAPLFPSSTYEAALLKALSPFEKSYVSRSLSRLFDSVNQLFVPGARATPTKDTLQSTIRTITRYIPLDYCERLTKKKCKTCYCGQT